MKRQITLKHWKTILTKRKGSVATISLNRSRVHNAMNLQMIRELSESILQLGKEEGIRIVVITSEGSHFSSGADVNWMREGIGQSADQMKEETTDLARLFRLIWESEPVILASVKGIVRGGANGILAAADLVVAENTSTMAFPEVKMGLVPATIAPYVLRKIGFSKTSEWMLTGRSFDAQEARDAGLVHIICDEGALTEATGLVIQDLLSNGPMAMKGIKQMLRKLETKMTRDELQAYTTELIAAYRISEEGQEGMKAFLKKRRPNWDENS